MKKNVKVSVVVPVYNVEDFLPQCLDSICAQTLKEIEIICVDDGSTDNSLNILKEFQEKDSRIQVYQQQNSYAGVARNNGKSHATGEYLVFWDSDDYFYETALEKMYLKCKADDADVCICNGKQFLQKKQVEIPAHSCLNVKLLPENIPFNIATNPDIILNITHMAPWNKMFRREYIENLNLDFQATRNANDIYFVANALCNAKRITVVNEALVCYRIEIMGLSSSLSKGIETPIRVWMDTAESLKKQGVFPHRSFANRALTSLLATMRKIGNSWPAFEEAVNLLKTEGLEKLGIEEREPGYYYEEWKEECLKRLIHGTPEEFCLYFLYTNGQLLTQIGGKHRASKEKVKKLKESVEHFKSTILSLKDRNALLSEEAKKLKKEKKQLTKDITQLTKENQSLKNSWEYKIGNFILFIPKKIKKLLKGKK